MPLRKEDKQIIENIFESKKEFHKLNAKLPIEEKIKILIKLQKIAVKANPEKMKEKKVWTI